MKCRENNPPPPTLVAAKKEAHVERIATAKQPFSKVYPLSKGEKHVR